MANYAERIAKGGFVIFVLTMITSVIGYFLRLYLARNLTVEDFGLFYAVLAFLSLLWVFKEMGIGTALAKYIPEFHVKKKFSEIKTLISSILLVQFAVGFVIFLALFAYSGYISSAFFHNASAEPVLQILAFEFLICTTIIRPVLQGLQKMRAYALVEFVRIIAVFITAVFFISIGVTGVALGYLIASVLVQIIFLAYIFGIIGKYKNAEIRIDKKIFSFGFFIFVGGLAGFLVSYTDTLVLTFFRSLDEVGFYQVAMPTSQLLWVFAGSLTTVLFPVMSEIWTKGQKNLLADGISLLVKFSLMFIIPFALIVIAFPEIVINLIFGPRYLPAAPALQILGFGAIFYTLMTILSTAVNAIGRPDISMKVIWVAAIFNLAGNIMLVPFMGITGAAIVSTLSFLLGFLALASYTKKHMTVRIPWASLGKAFAGGIATLILIYALKEALVMENAVIEAFICLAASFAFYFIFISRTRTITRSDLGIFRRANIYVPKIIRTLVLKFVK